MKKPLYLVVFLAFTALAACTKSQVCCSVPQTLMVTADKNDTSWMGSDFKEPGTHEGIVISAVAVNHPNNNPSKDTLIITFDYKNGQSDYKLTPKQVYFHSADGGMIKAYPLDTAYKNNIINVTNYETHWNVIEGTFSLKFLNPGKSDISFLNGKFEVPINL